MKEALKLALEALKSALSDDQPYIVKCGEAITAIKEALAQPERPWVGLTDEEVRKICVDEWGGYEQVRAIEAKLKEKNT